MSFAGLLNQSVAIRHQDGTRDIHGKRAFSAPTTVSARFERKYKTIVTAERENEPIHAIVFIPAGTAVSVGDRITYVSDDYRVMDKQDIVGRGGSVHHIELLLQLWSFA